MLTNINKKIVSYHHILHKLVSDKQYNKVDLDLELRRKIYSCYDVYYEHKKIINIPYFKNNKRKISIKYLKNRNPYKGLRNNFIKELI